MALTVTSILQQTSADGFGTGGFTSSGFTPGSGRRVLVICMAQSAADDAMEGSDLTISDSDSSITSWTSIVNSTSSPGWGYGSRAWVSDQGASGSSMTVTVDSGAFNIENYRLEVFDIVDFGGIGGTVAATSTNFISPVTINLSSAPASSSLCIGAANVSLGGGASTVTPGTGWTELPGSDVSRAAWYNFEIETRTGSTSTAVEWQDLASDPSPIGAVLIAFEIQEGAASDTLLAQACY